MGIVDILKQGGFGVVEGKEDVLAKIDEFAYRTEKIEDFNESDPLPDLGSL